MEPARPIARRDDPRALANDTLQLQRRARRDQALEDQGIRRFSLGLGRRDLLEIQARAYLAWLERGDPDYQGAGLRRCPGCGSTACRSVRRAADAKDEDEARRGPIHARFAQEYHGVASLAESDVEQIIDIMDRAEAREEEETS